MGFFLQILAARLGVVTGKNLAEMCTAVYPRWASLTLWIMTEIAIVGSDVQEVLGSSIAFQVLFGFPLWIGWLITGLDTLTFLLLHRYGIRKLEAFFVTLIGVMLVCFCANLVRRDVEPANMRRINFIMDFLRWMFCDGGHSHRRAVRLWCCLSPSLAVSTFCIKPHLYT